MGIKIDIDNKSDDEIMSEVLEEIFGRKSYFGGGTKSIQKANDTNWGSPNSWFTSGKFKYQFATIKTEDWIKIHNSIGHSMDGAYGGTVNRVKEDVKNGTVGDIPTPTLALEPDNFGTSPITYVPVHEGRSRGLGAYKAGLDRMPILVSVRRHWK